MECEIAMVDSITGGNCELLLGTNHLTAFVPPLSQRCESFPAILSLCLGQQRGFDHFAMIAAFTKGKDQ